MRYSCVSAYIQPLSKLVPCQAFALNLMSQAPYSRSALSTHYSLVPCIIYSPLRLSFIFSPCSTFFVQLA